jgi:hypothetical protein
MVYFFGRGKQTKTYEVRLDDTGEAYEMLVTEDAGAHREHFDTIQKLLAREHELTTAWRAMGWREMSTAALIPGRGRRARWTAQR